MTKSLVLLFHKEDDGILFEKIVIALKARYKFVSVEELENLLLKIFMAKEKRCLQ